MSLWLVTGILCSYWHWRLLQFLLPLLSLTVSMSIFSISIGQWEFTVFCWSVCKFRCDSLESKTKMQFQKIYVLGTSQPVKRLVKRTFNLLVVLLCDVSFWNVFWTWFKHRKNKSPCHTNVQGNVNDWRLREKKKYEKKNNQIDSAVAEALYYDDEPNSKSTTPSRQGSENWCVRDMVTR